MAVATALDISLRIWLFGPMRVEVNGRPIPPLRSRKALWVLALLNLRQGREVDRQWLAGALWPDAEVGQALGNLRPALSDLRRALGDQGSRIRLEGRHTVSLDLVGADVDVIEFDCLVDQGEFEQAIQLYRGPLLEGCNEEWAFQERDRRRQACLDALEAQAEKSRASGNLGAVIELCKRATVIDRLSDTAHRRLMVALEESGDRNAAMEVYREFSDVLRRELNAAPDKQTTNLYRRLRKDARGRDLAATNGPSDTVPGNLPHPVSALVGREDEREEVVGLLRRSRLVTLTGFGGIGKTRLALEVAASFGRELPDGAWFASLESLSNGNLIIGQIAAAFGVREVPGRSIHESLIEHLCRKRLILLLDNCEHILDSAAAIAGSLLKGCPGLCILATSRLALGIEEETVWPVPTMSTPDTLHLPAGPSTLMRVLLGYDAVRLFIERAEAVQSSFRVTSQNAASLANICFHLEGIPLAIELAAARMKTMAAEELAGRLDHRLGILTTGSRAAPARQQTLRATLDWSHDLLTEPERVLLRRLSVFSGGWTLEAATTVCADSSQDLDIHTLLASLVEKSLVVFWIDPLGGRYRLLEMVREYAAEELARSGEAAALTTSHRRWIVGFVEAAKGGLAGPDAEPRFLAIAAEHDNIRAALDACGSDAEAAEAALVMVPSLHLFWYTRGHVAEGLRYLNRALGHECAQAPTFLRARALVTAASLSGQQGYNGQCRGFAEEALVIWRALGNQRGIVSSLGTLGNLALEQGYYGQAGKYFMEVKEILGPLGDSQGVAHAVYSLGWVAYSRGDCPEARARLEESLLLFRAIGHELMAALNLRTLASVIDDQGNLDLAKGWLNESRLVYERFGDRLGVASVMQALSSVAYHSADLPLARSLAEESLAMARELGCRNEIANWTVALAEITCERMDFTSASSMLHEASHLARELGDKRCELDCFVALASLKLCEGDWLEARKVLPQCVDLLEQVESNKAVARCLEIFATINLEEGQPCDATRLWATADALRIRIGVPRPVNERASYEARLAKARLKLGEAAFAAAWEEGLSQSWQDALSL